MNFDPQRRRFTISQHTGHPEGDHYDLFLEEEGHLRTWRFEIPSFRNRQPARRIADHRKVYLEQEGEVSGGRGRVTIWDRGEYRVDAESPRHLRIALSGTKLRTRLQLDRTAETTPEMENWEMGDATLRLRAILTHHLRGALLALPESPELSRVHDDLCRWETDLVPVADRFAKGTDVNWTVLEQDPALPQRIRSLRARWVHPWLVSAYRFASRLDRCRRVMLAYRQLPEESVLALPDRAS